MNVISALLITNLYALARLLSLSFVTHKMEIRVNTSQGYYEDQNTSILKKCKGEDSTMLSIKAKFLKLLQLCKLYTNSKFFSTLNQNFLKLNLGCFFKGNF